MSSSITLQELGWKPSFQQQLSFEEFEHCQFGRLIEQHRSRLLVLTESGIVDLTPPRNIEPVCVGDWVLLDHDGQFVRVLERQSLFQRKSPGTKTAIQFIAANIDTLFIVMSLNQDFNLSRVERYLTLANDAGVTPVIVLTKADLRNDVDSKVSQVQALDPLLAIHPLNALELNEVSCLKDYCTVGQTVALVGSSGVGKSTLVNTLTGNQEMDTGAIRADDDKGRHTTTHRTIKRVPNGGLIMDTPGLRELQLTDSETGLEQTFSDITELANQCRFNNCSHSNEPNCAVRQAIENQTLPQRRFDNYQKLQKEVAFSTATLAERREKDKAFGKMINTVQAEARSRKKR